MLNGDFTEHLPSDSINDDTLSDCSTQLSVLAVCGLSLTPSSSGSPDFNPPVRILAAAATTGYVVQLVIVISVDPAIASSNAAALAFTSHLESLSSQLESSACEACLNGISNLAGGVTVRVGYADAIIPPSILEAISRTKANKPSSNSSSGPIIGGIVGALTGLAFLVLGYAAYRRYRANLEKSKMLFSGPVDHVDTKNPVARYSMGGIKVDQVGFQMPNLVV
jgi:hypothetical protein